MDRKSLAFLPPSPLCLKTTTKEAAAPGSNAASAMATPREQISSELVRGMATAPVGPPSVTRNGRCIGLRRGLRPVAQVEGALGPPRTRPTTTGEFRDEAQRFTGQ